MSHVLHSKEFCLPRLYVMTQVDIDTRKQKAWYSIGVTFIQIQLLHLRCHYSIGSLETKTMSTLWIAMLETANEGKDISQQFLVAGGDVADGLVAYPLLR